MTSTEPTIRKAVISGREIFICDNVIGPMMVRQMTAVVKSLHYVRKEKSRADVPDVSASCNFASDKIASDPFLNGVRRFVEKAFPGEQFCDKRAYVNCSVYGDSYYTHRDCGEHEADVTALYYANPQWHPDWGGETIYYNDQEDAEVVVMPRPGRLVIARGAILHRGSVPTRSCYEERFTLAYKLTSAGPSKAS